MKEKKYIIGFAIVLSIFVLVEFLKPKETDWTVSFSNKDKIPFGTYALFDLMKETVPQNMLKTNYRSFYEFVEKNQPENTNYIIITDNLELNNLSIRDILDYVEKGNNIFIAANYFDYNFLDTLKIEEELIWYYEDSIKFNFSNSKIRDKNGFYFNKKIEGNYFSIPENSRATILGSGQDSLINFVKIKHGQGNIYLNSQPFIYTNYNLLKKNNYEYVFKSLSYLPEQTTYWDEYFKPGNMIQNSPLRVVFSSPALKTAYYLLAVGLILYMLFIGKRQQRIIPIIKPLENTSLEFTETIARLYLHKKNNKDLSIKKYKFFLENIRQKHFINPKDFSFENIDKIAEKTGVKKDTIQKLLKEIEFIKQTNKITDAELYNFNKLIEKFNL